jgi:hypothetical protein
MDNSLDMVYMHGLREKKNPENAKIRLSSSANYFLMGTFKTSVCRMIQTGNPDETHKW